ncbi:hypothetical protein B0G75_117124 [Paraburkholderia sp. BL18I3N2]|nr:hypothetical protein B0G75_117124 [Paraburkholderia sp. BL18I3N2]
MTGSGTAELGAIRIEHKSGKVGVNIAAGQGPVNGLVIH